jgi:hypothetical protein
MTVSEIRDLLVQLVDDLWFLFDRKTIKSVWRPGMLFAYPEPPGEPWRRLNLMGPIRDPEGDDDREPIEYMGIDCPESFPSWGWPSRESGWLPDPEDPATVGCLTSLLREMTGEPEIHVWYSWQISGWIAAMRSGEIGPRPTEIEALISAIHSFKLEVEQRPQIDR